MDIPLPISKLALDLIDHDSKEKIYVVVVATGSFNPPTFMHLRIFELARDALNSEGFCVIGGYMSPVNDAYKKRGLVSAEHRIQLCQLACKGSDFIMVDPWEISLRSWLSAVPISSYLFPFLDFGFLSRSGPYAASMAWYAFGEKDKMLRKSPQIIRF